LSVHALTVPLLVGNSVPTSEVEGVVNGAVRKAQVDIGPDYEFQRDDLGVTWAVNRSFVTDTDSITIPGLEDTDNEGHPVVWKIKITFLSSGNKIVGGRPDDLFEIADDAGADLNYPNDVIRVDPSPRPDWAQNYVDAAAASAADAAASAAEVPGAVDAAVTGADIPGQVADAVEVLPVVKTTDPGAPVAAHVKVSNGVPVAAVEYDVRGRLISFKTPTGATAATVVQQGAQSAVGMPIKNLTPHAFVTAQGKASENMVDSTTGLTPDATVKRQYRRARELQGTATFVFQADSYGTTSPGGVAIPDLIATESGRPIIADGNSGWTSGELSIKSGGLPLLITFPSDEIPAATTPITVTGYTPRNPLWQAGSRTFTGYVIGKDYITKVPCTVTRSAAGVYTFTRTTAGAMVPALAETRLIPANSMYLTNSHLVMVGHNDIIFTTYGDPGSDAADTVANIRDIRDAMPLPRGSEFIVLSLINGVTMPYSATPSSGYQRTITRNNAFAESFAYFDVRTALIRNGLKVVGLTANSADTIAIGEDRVPEQLMYYSTNPSDVTHLSPAGKSACAKLTSQFLAEREALRA
jgi:hypothetical protein